MEWEGAGAVGGAEKAVPLPLPLASESQQPYVSELLSFTLDRLHKEPELLRVDAERIRRQMQEVAVSNYCSFIAAADALLAIRQEVSSIDNRLESMLGVDNISIRGLTWSKLLDWWLSGDVVSATDNVEEIANKIDKDVLETQRMLQLAASQKMNTDDRRAIFCIIMTGEDYLDAFEKLLRSELPGKQQDRDIMRVLVECCLQEKFFNKYYTVLASNLCEHDKNHKFTLQGFLGNVVG